MGTRTQKEILFALKRFTENFYDFQERRLATGGRTTSDKIVLFEVDKIALERDAKTLLDAEKAALKNIQSALKRIPFYVDTLSDKKRFRGLGPTLAAVILSNNDIERQDTRSKMWAFAGLRPMPCERCKLCHQVVEVQDDGSLKHPVFRKKTTDEKEKEKKVKCQGRETYHSGKSQRPEVGKKLPYNKWLRTKLLGVLGPCLLKANSPWRTFYDNYKARKIAQNWGISDGHRHNASNRYMIKMLLGEVWQEWRLAEGLPVREPYEEQYLGMKHHTPPPAPESVISEETGIIELAQIDEELKLALEDN